MATEKMISMPVGVIIERREIDNRWKKYRWRPVAIVPGAPPVDEWRVTRQGDGWIHYHAATLTLEMHRKETEAYKVNLADEVPSVFIVLREDPGADEEREYRPFVATVSPYEAQDYLDADDIVERVPMDEGLMAWVQTFTDRHHVDVPFKKRKRTEYVAEESGFGKPAPIDRPRRSGTESDDV